MNASRVSQSCTGALSHTGQPAADWLADYRSDVRKYSQLNGGSSLKQVLSQQGLWVLLEYRLERALYLSNLPFAIKRPLQWAAIVWHKLIEITTGVDIPCTARIGSGMHIPHCGNIVVHAGAVIGNDCCLSQGVTIGISGRGDRRGVPAVGDRVYFGANAVVVGPITVGDGSLIGANSLVNRDVPPNCTVLGVPAIVISRQGSADYIQQR